jgi:hypothetical protein
LADEPKETVMAGIATTLAAAGELSAGQVLREFWLPAMGWLGLLTIKLAGLWWASTVRRGRDPLEALADRTRQFIALLFAATVVVLAELITYVSLVAIAGWLWPSLAAVAIAVAEWIGFFTLVAKLHEAEERARQQRAARPRRQEA